MPEIDQVRVREFFARGDTAQTNVEKGRALEDLVAYVFELIPGVSLSGRNEMNAFEAEEIDLAFWNDGEPEGLRLFDHLLLVECKNWSTPVGYPEMAVFHQKLQSRGRPLGILVATCGITGNGTDRTAAYEVLAQALAQRREILVITRSELELLSDTGQLVDLLKRKRVQLTVSGTIYELQP
jgi:Restriction endonuclease